MLHRYLRKADKREGGPPEVVTYAEELLDSAVALLGDQLAGDDPADAVGAVAAALVEAEVDGGLPEPPSGHPTREQFERTYATLLLDNDRQPPALQMSGADLERPRALLASFFTGAPSMHADAQAVLRFIEERFAQGRFAQARLLLQLFDTDPGTRRNNERNIFYEEMSMRFLSQRSTPTPSPGKLDPHAPRVEFPEAGETLCDAFGIRLHTFGRDVARERAWASALEGTSGPARSAALNVIPGPRWREHWRSQPVLQALADEFATRGVRTFVANLTRCVYFITLAPGKTGYEDLVMRYVDWMGANFPVVPTRILPRLHRDSTLGERGIGEALDTIWDEQLASASLVRHAFEGDELEQAYGRVLDRLNTEAVSSVPEGEYDLGGLVAAELLGFDPGSVAHALRMNRLT